jgi:hypothetical protein
VPSTFTAATVPNLVADINAANQAGGSNTITLIAGDTFTLTAPDNTSDGATGLPVIAANDNLTIVVNGDVIERSTATGTPIFRLLEVAAGASLTLRNVTLQGGHAFPAPVGAAAMGGGILNRGTLELIGARVQNNSAVGGGWPGPAAGGGVWSNGALTIEGGTIVRGNLAQGGNGPDGWYWWRNSGRPPAPGADGSGGGVYVAGGTAFLISATLSSNRAQGGNGGAGTWYSTIRSAYLRGPGAPGGNGSGGGLEVAGGRVSLIGCTLLSNSAVGGQGASPGLGTGGGLFIDTAALVCLDASTFINISGNTASTSDPNIHGSWMYC